MVPPHDLPLSLSSSDLVDVSTCLHSPVAVSASHGQARSIRWTFLRGQGLVPPAASHFQRGINASAFLNHWTMLAPGWPDCRGCWRRKRRVRRVVHMEKDDDDVWKQAFPARLHPVSDPTGLLTATSQDRDHSRQPESRKRNDSPH